MKRFSIKKVLLSLYHYFCFFALMAFIITSCMLLFLGTMQKSMGITLSEENINTAARLTFLNVVFLSFCCTFIDAIRRKLTVERHVKKIVSAAEEISKGNYSVRIESIKSINRADGLEEISECFNKMAEELASVESMQSDFIANVSHELKTPLAVMKNYSALLSSPTLTDEERLHCTHCISEASERLAELITNILRLNKLESKQIFPKKERCDISAQLSECFLSFERIWEEKEIEISAELDEPAEIFCDPELLSIVWNNLISNALKFTEKGGKICVSLKSDEESITVRISDTGCGISPKVGKHIFEKFYQGDNSHATEGNGLGLALVKRVIDIVGGDISVESEVGRGSTFTLKLKRS